MNSPVASEQYTAVRKTFECVLFFCRIMGGSQPLYSRVLTLSMWLHLIFFSSLICVATIERHSHACCSKQKKRITQNASDLSDLWNETNRFASQIRCLSVEFAFSSHLKFFDFDLCEIQHRRESVSPTFIFYFLFFSISYVTMWHADCRAIDSLKQNQLTNNKSIFLFSVRNQNYWEKKTCHLFD